MRDLKRIILLIGAKGSGKSFIGSFIQEQFGVRFLRVEDWAMAVRRKREIDDVEYLAEVFDCIEKGIRQALLDSDQVVFESTGLTKYFDKMLEGLRRDYMVTTIEIAADAELCLDRIKSRDQQLHLSIAEDQVRHINAQVRDRAFVADFLIVNDNQSLLELRRQLQKIIDRPI